MLRQHDVNTRIVGKARCPCSANTASMCCAKGLGEFLDQWAPQLRAHAGTVAARKTEVSAVLRRSSRRWCRRDLPGLCTGCPERPFFAAMKILQTEVGALHISADIGCHSFATLPPFNMGNSIMGYGLGAAGASAFGTDGASVPSRSWAMAVFWHNGLTSGIGNAVSTSTTTSP